MLSVSGGVNGRTEPPPSPPGILFAFGTTPPPANGFTGPIPPKSRYPSTSFLPGISNVKVHK